MLKTGPGAKRQNYILPYLLLLLAALMTTHLVLLMAKDRQCQRYEEALLARLSRLQPDSDQARNLRNEIQNFFGGRYTDCSQTDEAFAATADKYLAVILSLLTGAGAVSAARYEQERRDLSPPEKIGEND